MNKGLKLSKNSLKVVNGCMKCHRPTDGPSDKVRATQKSLKPRYISIDSHGQCDVSFVPDRADLSGSSMTVIMMYCAEAGIEFLPIVERIRSHVKKTGNDHFAFDLRSLPPLS